MGSLSTQEINAFSPKEEMPTLQLRFLTEAPCSGGGLYCATIQIKVIESGEETTIGTSGIFFEYNADALSYASYTSIHFDGSDSCIPLDGFVAWDPHGFDPTEPGKFNLVLNLQGNASAFSCPTITSTEWVDVGVVCFDVLDATETTDLTFAPEASLTSFNTSDNDGSMIDVDRDNMGNVNEMPLGGSGGVAPPVITSDDGLVICAGGTGTPTYVTLTSNVTTPSGYTPQWQLDGNDVSTNPNFNPTSILANQAGDYTLMYAPTESGCESGFSNSLTVVEQNCAVEKTCPTVTPLNESEEVCNGSFNINALLSSWQNNIAINDPDGTAGNLILSSVPTTSSVFSLTSGPTGVYSGDGCTTDTQIWYAGLECNNDDDAAIEEYIAAGIFTLTIYPTPQAPTLVSSFIEDSQACIYSFETVCTNDNVDVNPVGLNESCGATDLNNVNVNVTNEQGCTAGPFSLTKPDCGACASCVLEVMDLNSFCVSSTTYIVDIVYQFSNTSSGDSFSVFDQNNNNLGSFNYGDTTQVGPFDLDGGTYSFELIDDNNINCNASSGVATIPTDCVPECLADGGTVSLSQSVLCASDLSSVIVDVSGINTSNGYDSRFFITNAAGTILNGFSANGPVLNGLGEGTYCLYTVSFDEVNGIDENANTITDLGDGCYDISECFLFDFYDSVPILGITTSPTCDEGVDTYTVGITAQNGTGTAIIYGLPNSPITINVGQESMFVLPQETNYTLTVEDGLSGCSPQNSFSVVSPNCDVNCEPASASLTGNTEACAGTMVNLNSFLSIPSGTVVSWALGNTIITNPNNVNVNTTNCNGESTTYVATYAIDDSNGCPLNHTYTLDVFVYPLITGSISNNGCTINLSQDCSNFTASWTDGTTTQNGFAYTAGVGTTGTVVFTIRNIDAPDGCNLFTVTENFDCADPCDSNSPVVETVTDDLCSGANFSLNSYVSIPANTIITWSNGGGTTVQNPNNLTASNNSCTAQTFLFTATYSLTENGCSVDYTTNVEIDVYPMVTATVTASNCGVSISQACPTFTATWTNNGTTENGFNYTATEGTSGTVNFTVTNAAAPANCNSFSISGNYDCPVACEEETITTNMTYDRCAGATFSLGEQANIPNNAVVTWRDGVGNVVSNPEAMNLTNATCVVKTFDYQATYTLNNGDCPVNYVINLEVDIYPSVTATVTASNCGVSISQACPTFTATWTNNGTTENGFSYTATEGTSGTVNFTVTNAAAPANCNSFSISGNYDCPVACEEETITTNMAYDRCAGATFSLGEQLNTPNNVTVTWRDASGQIVSTPEAMSLSNTSCSMTTSMYEASYTTMNSECPVNHIVNLAVNVYPEIQASVINNGCSISLSQDCSNFATTWEDNLGETGFGVFYEGTEGAAGSVTFTVSNTAAPTNCQSISLTGNYDCPVICEEVNNNNTGSEDICANTSFSLSEFINAPANVSVTWKDGVGQVVSNPNSLNLSNDDCVVKTFDYTGEYTTFENECPINHLFSLSINIYPAVTASLIDNDDCSVSISQDCPNFVATWTMGNTNGNGFTYAATEGTSGTVTFTVSNPNAPSNCNSFSLSGDFDCPIPCNNETVTSSMSYDRCSNVSFSLGESLEVSANLVQWVDGANNSVADSNNMMLENTGCETDTYNYTGTYTLTDNNGCPTEYVENLSVNIYPEITANLMIGGECIVGISQDCPNFTASWSDGTQNNNGFSYNATTGTSGTVSFTVSNTNAPQNCNSLTMTGNFDCPTPCNNEPVTNTVSADAVCDNTSLDLNDYVTIPAGTTVTWTNNTGATITSVNNVLLTNNSCTVKIINYTANYTLFDGEDCPISHTITVSTQVYPAIDVNISGGQCTVNAISQCSNVTATWSDNLGQSGNSLQYTAVSGTSGTVTFTISNSDSPQDCFIQVDGDFNCPFTCLPQTNTVTVSNDVCEGTGIDLYELANVAETTGANWYNGIGIFIPNSSNLNLSNPTCFTQTYLYKATYASVDENGCTVDNVINLSLKVHPKITTLIIENANECTVQLTQDCSNFTASWATMQGGTGNGFSYEATGESSDIVTFIVSDSNSEACNVLEVVVEVNCGDIGCESQIFETATTEEVCGSSSLNLNNYVNTNNLVGWKDSDGNIVSNPNNMSLTANGCTAQNYTFVGSYTQSNGDCIDQYKTTLSITVYPEATTAIIEEGCNTVLSQNCDDFTASWTNSLGESGNGFSYNANEGTEGTITFTIESPNCSSIEINTEFECTDPCGNGTVSETEIVKACNGETMNLYELLPIASGVAITWTDALGNTVQDADALTLTNNENCETTTATYTATYALIGLDGCTTNHEFTISFVVYPNVTAEVSNTECEVISVIGACPNYSIIWEDSNGATGNNNNYTVPNNGTGSVTFTIENGLGPDCATASFTESYTCIGTDSYADLALSMYFDPSYTVMVGDIVECVMTVINNGPATANNVTVFDVNLDAFEFQDAEGDGVYTPAGYWILGNIPPNSEMTHTVQLQALEEGVFNFVSYILSSVEEDANPDNNAVSEYLTVIANISGGETPEIPETPEEEECEPYNCGQDMVDCISIEYASEICPAFCEDMGGNYTITGVDPDNSSSIEVDGQCVTFMPSPLAIVYGEETVVFIAENADGICASLTVYIDLGDCNIGPQAIDDFYSLEEGSLSFDPTTNDSNDEDAVLTICGEFTQPMNGTLIFDDGTFTYTPNGDFFGTDSFSYFVCDTAGNSSFAMVYLEVPGYVESCEEDIIIQECTEFVEPVIICLDYCQFGSISFSITDITTTFDCTLAILDDLCFRYTPLPSVTEGTDIIEITGCSEILDDCQTIEAEITIGCATNLPPIAEEDNATTSEEESIVITVLDNDEDPDGDPINVCAYTQPLLGMVEAQSNGTFIYYPSAGYTGSDSFTYTVCDINGASTISTVYIEVYAVEATCDSNQELCTPAFTALTICLDFCEDNMEIEDIAIPFHCSIVELDDNCFRYTPLPAFAGTETIEVEGCNGNDCEIATITIEVGEGCDEGFRIENNTSRLQDISLHENCELNIPNVFTPNQDGINDILALSALTECYANMDIEFTIFTRTGILVFAAQNIQDGILWRGENLQQEGTYFYRLRIQYEGETLDKTGFIEVRQ